MPATSSVVRFAAGLSTHPQTMPACEQVVGEIRRGLGEHPPDLVLAFYSPHHLGAVGELPRALLDGLGAPGAVLAGVSCSSVLGGGVELENVPGLSVLAGCLPGARVRTITGDELFGPERGEREAEHLARVLGMDDDLAGVLLFTDPFSTPLVRLLPALNAARRLAGLSASRGVIAGGIASASRAPLGNTLLLGDRAMHSGALAVALSGALSIDAIVSQGCRGFGPTAVITRAKGNIIFELGGRPTQEVIREAVASLPDSGKASLRDGIQLGLVINEYKDRFGRADFLIRNVVGLDQNSGGVAIADIPRVGQTVRFHHRDRATADEDLAMLLDAQRLHDPPAGCLIVADHARGTRLFSAPHHDTSAFARAFAPLPAGEQLAKGGKPFAPATASPVPTAGFFAHGEIGPVGGSTFLHDTSLGALLFRDRAT